MSARMFMIVLRIACDRVGVEDPWEFMGKHADKFAAVDEDLGFHVALTKRKFIDYVLKCEVTEKESYGETRALTRSEREEYGPIFRELFPDIEMQQVRYVEFAWYDSTEAPDYYMPCLIKKITIFDTKKLVRDKGFHKLYESLNEKIGNTGRFWFRFSGIPYENLIFVEAETEKLCEKSIAKVEEYLKENGYSES